jgi:ribose 5-phosphate isomerase A
LELHEFGLRATLRELGDVSVRDGARSPDGGVLADYHGDIGNPRELSEWLASTPGISAHGLFAPEYVSDIIVATGKTVSTTTPGGPQ